METLILSSHFLQGNETFTEWLYGWQRQKGGPNLNMRFWVTKPSKTSIVGADDRLVTSFEMSSKSLWIRAKNLHKEIRDSPLTLYSQGNWGPEKGKDFLNVTCSLFYFYLLFKWLSQSWVPRHLVILHGVISTPSLCLFKQKGLYHCLLYRRIFVLVLLKVDFLNGTIVSFSRMEKLRPG